MRPALLAAALLPLAACAGDWTHPRLDRAAIEAAKQDCADQGWLRLKQGYENFADAAGEAEAPGETYVLAGAIGTLHGLGLMIQFREDCMRARGFARAAQ